MIIENSNTSITEVSDKNKIITRDNKRFTAFGDTALQVKRRDP